ncbi:MAG: antirestriction protein ArdA [Oscillospiraceae bacterium]|nr:antirestriction protein ArdA [Oscillospiraceae bacterium]
MQFQAVLCNRQHPEYGVATIPFPVPGEEYDNVIRLLEPLGLGDEVKQDCHIEEIRGDIPALKQIERTNANLDELDYLAKRLDSFDPYELTQFQGMASRLDLHGVDELINLTFCCQEVTVITDFNDLDSLGRKHYLTMNGGGASAAALENVDGKDIATELILSEIGRVTPYGVVYDNDMKLSQAYDGRHFPEYRYADSLMEVELRSRFAPADSPAAYLFLPIPQAQIERNMIRAGISNYGDMCLRFMESELPEEIDAALDMENESLTDINEMCRAIKSLTAVERSMLGGAVLLAQPETASQVRQLAENLDQFDYVYGVQTPGEYGEYMIKESGNFEYDENLGEYYDFEKYGLQRMEQEGGVFNQRGYIAYLGTLSLDELMMDDPAQEHGMEMGGME